MLKKFLKIIYKVLTVISCLIKALNSFTNAHYENHSTFDQQFYALELQKFGKNLKKIKVSLKITKAQNRIYKKTSAIH